MRDPDSAEKQKSIPWPYFPVSKPRPRSFTGPESELWGSRCRELIEKQDEEYDWRDYQAIFSEFESLATYEESVYFLPYAFSRVLTHPEEALDLIDPVLVFSSENARRLQSDGDLNAVASGVRELLNAWTKKFYARPNEEDTVVGTPRVKECCDHVNRRQLLNEALGCLIRRRTLRNVAEEFVRSLAESSADPAKASWFLTLAYAAFWGESELPAHTPMLEIIRNEEFLADAAASVRNELTELGQPSLYWKRCLDRLCV